MTGAFDCYNLTDEQRLAINYGNAEMLFPRMAESLRDPAGNTAR
jgi:hypothetical protein